MKLIPPWVRWLAIAIIAAGLVYAGHEYASNTWRAKYTERENELLANLAKQQDKVRGLERAAAEDNAAIDAAYQRGLSDARERTASTLADLRAGNQRLRRDLAASACREASPTSTAGIGDGEAGAQLWRQSAEALIGIADEADGVVDQLTACQGVIENYRQKFGPED